jgi:hypothetical protein
MMKFSALGENSELHQLEPISANFRPKPVRNFDPISTVSFGHPSFNPQNFIRGSKAGSLTHTSLPFYFSNVSAEHIFILPNSSCCLCSAFFK